MDFPRAGVTQLVECDLAKVDVAGSNPVSRSKHRARRNAMIKLSSLFILCTAAALAQDYKLEPISTPPPGLPAAYSSEIQSQGYRVTGPNGPWCEIWFRN